MQTDTNVYLAEISIVADIYQRADIIRKNVELNLENKGDGNHLTNHRDLQANEMRRIEKGEHTKCNRLDQGKTRIIVDNTDHRIEHVDVDSYTTARYDQVERHRLGLT